ncbi:MAG: hypothetical protein MRZ52_03465, partial [Oscillospiraceae bacterium]|nr:hypothetical protein [Oscillospiraceae bacterium]
ERPGIVPRGTIPGRFSQRSVSFIEFCKAKLSSVRETCFAALGITFQFGTIFSGRLTATTKIGTLFSREKA